MLACDALVAVKIKPAVQLKRVFLNEVEDQYADRK